MSDSQTLFDAVIVGGGPAGLSAALVLGRCRRRVLVCDEGHPRNAASHALHGYLSRDGIPPAELLRIGREHLRPYETVQSRSVGVTDARPLKGHFAVTLADGSSVAARKVLLATGVTDLLPPLAGMHDFYGSSVFHCPYCDGWELRDQRLAVYGKGEHGSKLAFELTTWSTQLLLCTDGPSELNEDDCGRLHRLGIEIHQDKIRGLEGTAGILERIRFVDGTSVSCRAMFFSTGEAQSCGLAAQLGCKFTPKGTVNTGEYETTNIPGLYVAGDASRDVQAVIVAAAEGYEAAVAINTALAREDLDARLQHA
ncbi:MAG: NAD(P)/FAD-dependent oxidoreductase [Candidatus Eisenbacteria bacterium]